MNTFRRLNEQLLWKAQFTVTWFVTAYS